MPNNAPDVPRTVSTGMALPRSVEVMDAETLVALVPPGKNVVGDAVPVPPTVLVASAEMTVVEETHAAPAPMVKPVTEEYALELGSEPAVLESAVMTELEAHAVHALLDKDVEEVCANVSTIVMRETAVMQLLMPVQSVVLKVAEPALLDSPAVPMDNVQQLLLVTFRSLSLIVSPTTSSEVLVPLTSLVFPWCIPEMDLSGPLLRLTGMWPVDLELTVSPQIVPDIKSESNNQL